MKNLITTITTVLFALTVHSQIISFPNEDRLQIGIWTDPTFTDKGAQFGVDATGVMRWGFVGASLSNYSNLGNVGYTDLVGQLGVNFHLANFEPVRYYIGARLGYMWRGNGGYPLAGGLAGFDICLSKYYAKVKLYVGLKFWTDYREDQEAGRYGDVDAYKPGLITNNPLLQENGAGVISISF